MHKEKYNTGTTNCKYVKILSALLVSICVYTVMYLHVEVVVLASLLPTFSSLRIVLYLAVCDALRASPVGTVVCRISDVSAVLSIFIAVNNWLL